MQKILPLKSIRGRLFLLLLIVLVSVLLVEAFVYYKRFETQKSEELQANLEMARAFAKTFETFLRDLVHGELVVGLALTASQPITERDRNRILDEFHADHPAVRSIFWMNDQGLVIASSLRSYIGFNLSDRSFFQRVQEGRKWAASELIVGRATHKPAFVVSRGIRNEQGKLLGIVAASVDPDFLDSALGIERLKDAGISLIDNKGMHVYRYPDTDYTWEQRNWLKLYPVIEYVLKGEEKAIGHISKLTGVKRLVAFVPISSIGWVAAASRAEDEAMKGITSTLLFEAGLVLLVTLVSFGAAVALARPISNSIIGLRNHALALGRGEMENLLPISGPEELKDLAVVFNKMVGDVRSREAALRESEERFRSVVENMSEGLMLFDAQGMIYQNPASLRIHGFEGPEEMRIEHKELPTTWKGWDETGRPLPFEEWPVSRVLRHERFQDQVLRAVGVETGREFYASYNGSPILGPDGKMTLGFITIRDITARKRAEEERERLLIAVREEKDRLSALINSIQDEVWFADTKKSFTLANPSALREFGFNGTTDIDVREFVESLEVYHPDGTPRPVEEAQPLRALQGEVVTNEEEIIRSPRTGELRVRQVSATPVKDAGGHIIGSVSVVRDITESKRAEEVIKESEEKYRNLFTNMSEGFGLHEIIVDAGGKPCDYRFLDVNPAFERLTGLKGTDVLGKRVLEVLPGTEGHWIENYGKVALTGEPVRFENFSTSLDRWYEVFAYRPAPDQFAVVFTDVTLRKRAEEALQQRTLELQHLSETLEERVKARTEELAHLSSQLVSAQEDERRRVSYDLHDNVWQMLVAIRFGIENLFSGQEDWGALRNKSKQVMTDILGLVGKIRSMQGDLWPYVLDDIGLAATIDWYCREFGKNHSGLVIEMKNEIMDREIPSSAKIVIYRILQETLDNVAKHSQAGRVTLHLMKRDHGMEFNVEDNGIGFDPEETIVKRAPWSGLGLLSIKARTELSGGIFGVESAKGKGTIIRASWPV